MAPSLVNAPLNTKVTEAEKAAFVEICNMIGTTPSNALRMFVSAFNRRGGFPFDPSNPNGYNSETLQAMDDAASHRNLSGPYCSVDDLMKSLESED